MNAVTTSNKSKGTNKTLAINLAKAESEKEVIKLLKDLSLWDDDASWVPYGGDEGNYATIGGQQSSAENALIEKFTNSTDAMLLKECHLAGIDPESDEAPQSIEEALNQLYGIREGKISTLSPNKRAQLAENIGFAATGEKQKPNFVFFDKGIGQAPSEFEDTFVSLKRSNKLKIKCLMGKFNQGSTGVLPFSGDNKLQLIITRKFEEGRDGLVDGDEWAFTLVRREDPKDNAKSSVYTYLKPNNKILSFKAKELPILPAKYPEPYGKSLTSGSFIKVYNYATKHKTNIILDLFYRLNALLPNPALPIRFYERRKGYNAHSYESNFLGLESRFSQDRGENMENGFPASATLNVQGEKINVKIYAFKDKKKIAKYINSDGVIFTYYGQTQGTESKRFFKRSSVNLSYAADFLSVIVDFSNVSIKAKDEIFMASRDRLRKGKFYNKIISELEDLLKKHKGLRSFQEAKRSEFITKDLSDSKPIEEVLNKVLQGSPVLASVLGIGNRLSNPTKTKKTVEKKEFKGKQFPTFFKPEREYTQAKPKNCASNARWRVSFTTDVENDYLEREYNPGEVKLLLNGQSADHSSSINFWNGYANLNVELPDGAKEGDCLHYKISVNDINQINPIEHDIYVQVTKAIVKPDGRKKPGKRRNPPSNDSGDDSQSPLKMALPNANAVKKEDWKSHGFDEFSALGVKHRGDNVYDYFYNIDNYHLLHEKRRVSESKGEVITSQYTTALVLIGMMILKEKANADNEEFLNDKEKFVEVTTRIISPLIIPMLSSLGALGVEN